MLSKSLIQFFVNGWGCVPSLLFDLGPNYGGGSEDDGDLLQQVPRTHCYTHNPQPCGLPLPAHAAARDSWRLPGKSGSVSCGGHCSFLLGPDAHKFLFLPSKSCFPVLCKSWWLSGGVNDDLLQEGLCQTQVCCTQSLCPCGRSLLNYTFTGGTKTQFWLSLCGVPGSW